MRDPDMTTLRLFVAVCEERSLSRAADRCAIAASAISKRMAALEAQWDTPLLSRKRHGMVPTAAGETLLQHARTLLRDAQRMQRDMRDQTRGVRGQVRILATASNIAQGLVMDVAAFLKEPIHAGIRVDIEEAISPEIPRRVADGESSLGIAWDQVDMVELSTSPYIRDELAVVTPPDHPLARRRRVWFTDTLQWEYVGLPVTSMIYRIATREAGRLGKTWQPRVVMANHEVAMRAVLAGLAIALAPRDIANEFARAHPIAIVALRDAWAKRLFVVCHHALPHLNPATRALLDYLRRQAQVRAADD
ncbi:MAG: LysR substrate-binding domain-containing protein [Burkholderiaceae bacterium]